MNLVECSTCGASLIAEELATHQCVVPYKVVDLRYNWWVNTTLPQYGEVLLIEGDDATLYRFIQTKTKHPNKTPEDSTEPKNSQAHALRASSSLLG